MKHLEYPSRAVAIRFVMGAGRYRRLGVLDVARLWLAEARKERLSGKYAARVLPG